VEVTISNDFGSGSNSYDCFWFLEVRVHPKMSNVVIFYSPLCCSTAEWVVLFCWTWQKIFLKMLVTSQLTVAIDFHRIFFPTMEVNGHQQLFDYILQNRKKVTQVWNNVNKWRHNFWVNYPFNCSIVFYCSIFCILTIINTLKQFFQKVFLQWLFVTFHRVQSFNWL